MIIPFPGRPVPSNLVYLIALEGDNHEPESIHYGEDELSPEEFEQVLEEQATMQRTVDARHWYSMAHIPDSVLGLD